VRSTENVISQLGLAVDVDGSGSFAAQELAEDLAGPVGKLFFIMCRYMVKVFTGLPE